MTAAAAMGAAAELVAGTRCVRLSGPDGAVVLCWLWRPMLLTAVVVSAKGAALAPQAAAAKSGQGASSGALPLPERVMPARLGVCVSS